MTADDSHRIPWRTLSLRQCRVLDLLAEGRTNPEIAEDLGLTLDGAKYHVREVLTKLGADTREDAARLWKDSRKPGWLWRTRAVLLALGQRPLISLAAIGVFGAVAGIIFVALRVGSREYTDEPTADATSPAARSAGQGMDALAIDEGASPRFCELSEVSFELGTSEDGADTLIQLSARTGAVCQLVSTASVTAMRPISVPAPPVARRANFHRSVTFAVQFPLNGPLASWRWSNWCGTDPPYHSWYLAVPRSGALEQAAATPVPGCSDRDQPTVLADNFVHPGVTSDVPPDLPCPVGRPGWLCEAAWRATRINEQGHSALAFSSQHVDCGEAPADPQLAAVCEAALPAPYVLATRIVKDRELLWADRAHISAHIRLSYGPEVTAIGCPVDDAGCHRFVVAIPSRDGASSVLLAFGWTFGGEPLVETVEFVEGAVVAGVRQTVSAGSVTFNNWPDQGR